MLFSIFHLYLFLIIKFPFNILIFHFLQKFRNYSFCTSFQQILLQSCPCSFPAFFFSLLPKKSPFIFLFSYLHYHEVEKLCLKSNFLPLFTCFYIQMHECTTVIINPFHLFKKNFLVKGLLWRGGGSLKSELKQTGEGEESNLSLCLLC